MITHAGIYNKRGGSSRCPSTISSALVFSLILNALLAGSLLFFVLSNQAANKNTSILHSEDRVWHGGHPADDRSGSCWCGSADGYCMCTPNLAIDLILLSGRDHVWLVRRKDTGQLATMGGFVDVGETVEQAVRRELNEEMGLSFTAPIHLFGIYSDPRRDNRRNTVSAVFCVHLEEDLHPHAADDVKDVQRIALDEIEQHEYFADHRTILTDYRRSLLNSPFVESTEGDFANDIQRSTCSATPSVVAAQS